MLKIYKNMLESVMSNPNGKRRGDHLRSSQMGLLNGGPGERGSGGGVGSFVVVWVGD